MTVVEQHNQCLVCASSVAAVTDSRGVGTWYYLDDEGDRPHRVQPFCSQPCVDAWKLWSPDAQLTAIFGSLKLAEDLLKMLAEGTLRVDVPTDHVFTFTAPEMNPVSKCPEEDTGAFRIINGIKRCAGCTSFSVQLRERPWTPESGVAR